VELCLFDADGAEERVEIPENSAHVHHGYFPGLEPGQRYGFRVHGQWDPGRGRLSNSAKLLLDPYARAIDGTVEWVPALHAHDPSDPTRPDPTDSAPFVPRSVLVDGSFDWGNDFPPRHAWHKTVIYETHVRGLTMTHPDVPQHLRGTYSGMACKPVIDHLVGLGITAVELMPVHHFIPEGFLRERGLTNYWGYATASFFAPHAGYSASGSRGQQVTEFKSLVKTLHAAGIEVILDVVYNHTTEGGPTGPMLSLRGIDNSTYYRLAADDPSTYHDTTGTGNSLNVDHPAVLQMVTDSLRYWVTDMHVDGFRFDLALSLTRSTLGDVRGSSFLDSIHQDPVINATKLIAEPWDVGLDGYQLGGFPPIWSEWNSRYRDDVRDYWRCSAGSRPNLAMRFAGSSDLYDRPGRRTWSSINFITSHDGFTLADLVAFDHRHNEANSEGNEDGHRDMRSWNGGIEGPTDDPAIAENRRRRQFSMMATLLLSQGVPMILGGDEIGRSQQGNNNAYCQDNEISWYDWSGLDHEMLGFTRKLVELRKRHPVFRRGRFFEGVPALGGGLDDIGWFLPDGSAMSEADWHQSDECAMSVFLNGNALSSLGPYIDRSVDRSFLVMCNSESRPVDFTVPDGLGSLRWRVVFDISDPAGNDEVIAECDEWRVGAHAMTLLQRDHLLPVGP